MTNPISRMFGEKKQWRQYKARVAALPEPYRSATDAVEHYLLHVGSVFVSDSDGLMRMFDDLVELFEQSAADGTPVRDIVGEDPVAFVEDFITNYPSGRWITKERNRLNESIARASKEQS